MSYLPRLLLGLGPVLKPAAVQQAVFAQFLILLHALLAPLLF